MIENSTQPQSGIEPEPLWQQNEREFERQRTEKELLEQMLRLRQIQRRNRARLHLAPDLAAGI